MHTSYSVELSPTGPKVWEIILRSWQVELSTWAVKIRNQPIQKRYCFWYRKLCACYLLTWGLNVVLRCLTSADFCIVKTLWASDVPESSRCWQPHSNYHIVSHFARHVMRLVCIDILKIVNWKCTVCIYIYIGRESAYEISEQRKYAREICYACEISHSDILHMPSVRMFVMDLA